MERERVRKREGGRELIKPERQGGRERERKRERKREKER